MYKLIKETSMFSNIKKKGKVKLCVDTKPYRLILIFSLKCLNLITYKKLIIYFNSTVKSNSSNEQDISNALN